MIGFEDGDPVLVYAPTFYREKRIGLVNGFCKDHDGAIRVLLIDPNAPIKTVCVGSDERDTIERLSSPPVTPL